MLTRSAHLLGACARSRLSSLNNKFVQLVEILDLEWKIIYVGSAESEDHDQVLDTVYVGPVPEGRHRFMFQVSQCSQGPRKVYSQVLLNIILFLFSQNH